ncbi:TraE/TraK family type IV conjugative transfer system protein [Pseudoalteromonas rubra]|uniref:Uncharacterized protein n=1 Tax=Pseudoalteromonas rubra TaxID=43658 RepID=A0A0U3HYJ9_9GAMM|nr:TraE/TraK family type IV conjugative transfer system protein [Pseudoalteromonas rubra]ALU46152.1 hypothetical protein AT705_24630 [Pseudoalteromonas rubra]
MLLRKNSPVLKSVQDIKNSNRHNLFIQYTLLGIILILVLILLFKDTEIVAIPPNMQSEIRIMGNQANQEYKVRWAFSVAAIAGNISKDNSAWALAQLESMLSPYLRQQVMPAIRQEVNILVARNASQSFVIKDVIYDTNKDLVWVWGDREIKVKNASNKSVVPQRWTYEMRIEPFGGRAAVTHLNSYQGLPRNRDVEYTVEPAPLVPDDVPAGTQEQP